jgi:hypothetical protein
MNGLIMLFLAAVFALKRLFLFLVGLPILLVMFLSLVGGKHTEDFRMRCAKWMKENLSMHDSVF